MKKNTVLMMAAAALALGLALAGCGTTTTASRWANVTYHGEETPLLEGTRWTLVELDDGSRRVAEFRSGGIFVRERTSGASSWQRIGNSVEIVFNNGYSRMEGTYNSATGTIQGTGSTSGGHTWQWTMEPLR